MDAYEIAASALTAQRLRMDVIAGNLANVNTTRKEDGTVGPYHRKNVIFGPVMDKAMREIKTSGGDIAGTLPMKPTASGISMGPNGPMISAGIHHHEGGNGMGVQVMGVKEDTESKTRMVFQPGHPDANEEGYVEMPNVNVVSEMVDMISASRAYEANVSAFQAAKAMGRSAMEM